MTAQTGIDFKIELFDSGVTNGLRRISGEMKQVQKAVSFKDSLKGVGESWSKVMDGFQRIAVFGGAVAGIGAGLVGWAKSAVDAADDIGDLATRYGVASEAIQVYGDLVKDAGGSTEDAASAFKFLNKSMHGAIHGNKKLQAAFAGVGISMKELKGLKPEQVMERVADAFQGSNNELAKQAVLTALMGKNGTVMMGVMNNGSQAIRDHYAQMNADGRLFTQSQLTNADAFAKQWQRTAGVFEGMKNTLGLELMGALAPLIDKFRDWAVANKDVIASGIKNFIIHLPPLLQSVADVAGGVGSVFSAISGPFKSLSHAIGMNATVWIALGIAVAPLGVALVSLGGSLLTVGSVLAGLLPAGSAVMATLSGLGLVFKMALPAILPVAVAIGALGVAGYMLYKNWDGVVGGAKALWSDLGDAVVKVGEKITAHWEAMKGGAVAIWTDLSNFFSGIVDSIVLKFQSLKDMLPSFGGFKNLFSGTDIPAMQSAFTGGGNQSPGSGGVPALLAQKQQVGGQIHIKVDSEGRAKVANVQKQGGVDFLTDMGQYGIAM